MTNISGCLAAHYFYPRPPRGGRPSACAEIRSRSVISIHAPREEGDSPHPPCAGLPHNFYPRPPRGGRPASPATAGA